MSNLSLPVNTSAQLLQFMATADSNPHSSRPIPKPPMAIPSVSDFYKAAINGKSNDELQHLKLELSMALTFISSDDRSTWVKVGHALFSLGELGQQLWMEWSKKSSKFNQSDAEQKWPSFKNTKTSYQVVFKMAADNGWVNPIKKTNHVDEQGVRVGNNRNSSKQLPDFSWTAAFTLSEEEANEIADPMWIYKNLIIQGHLIAIPAPPNGGKTTIVFHLVCQLADEGYKVIYVNADISAGDAKSMMKTAHKKNVELLLPEMKAGSSMNDVVNNFKEMNNINADYSGYIVVFDTYKKMTDVISKSQSKVVLQLLRGLTAKGMTIILLSHTNKYKDSDDNHIFEGTGDLRADVDELIYLVPQKHPDGSMTVSTRPDKVRGDFTPITFEISSDRLVTRSEGYIDVHAVVAIEKDIERDDEVINLIIQKLKSEGNVKRADLIDYVRFGTDVGRDKVIKVLDRWNGKQWVSTKDKANHNTITYSIKQFSQPPAPPSSQ